MRLQTENDLSPDCPGRQIYLNADVVKMWWLGAGLKNAWPQMEVRVGRGFNTLASFPLCNNSQPITSTFLQARVAFDIITNLAPERPIYYSELLFIEAVRQIA